MIPPEPPDTSLSKGRALEGYRFDEPGCLGGLGGFIIEPTLTVLTARTTVPHRLHLFRTLEVTDRKSAFRNSSVDGLKAE